MTERDDDLTAWLEAKAHALDVDADDCAAVLPRLAGGGIFSAGLAARFGGGGGDIADSVEAIAEVSSRSMAAGFVAWGHRSFIEYCAQSTNAALHAAYLAPLLAGEIAGATGLSNAMKALSGLEGLQIVARRREDGGFQIDGKLPWVTNLRKEGFVVAAATAEAGSGRMLVVAVPSDAPGLGRSCDLNLMAMRASNTAAIDLADVPVGADHLVTDDARGWLPRVRPAFLGLQCGLSIGLARRALAEASASCGAGRHILREPIDDVAARLSAAVNEMYAGLRGGAFVAAAARLFELRIALADIALEASALELQAAGGRAYLAALGAGFARRWREAAFIPVITPSLVQLKAALAAQRQEKAA